MIGQRSHEGAKENSCFFFYFSVIKDYEVFKNACTRAYLSLKLPFHSYSLCVHNSLKKCGIILTIIILFAWAFFCTVRYSQRKKSKSVVEHICMCEYGWVLTYSHKHAASIWYTLLFSPLLFYIFCSMLKRKRCACDCKALGTRINLNTVIESKNNLCRLGKSLTVSKNDSEKRATEKKLKCINRKWVRCWSQNSIHKFIVFSLFSFISHR